MAYPCGLALLTVFVVVVVVVVCLCLFHVLQEKEQKYSLKLEEMKVRDVESGRFAMGKKHAFALFYNTGRWGAVGE